MYAIWRDDLIFAIFKFYESAEKYLNYCMDQDVEQKYTWALQLHKG